MDRNISNSTSSCGEEALLIMGLPVFTDALGNAARDDQLEGLRLLDR